jgi:hypothetical protein
MSNAATMAITTGDVPLLIETKKNIFQICSETSRFITVMVAVYDVLPHGLLHNVKYWCSVSASQSCCAIGECNLVEIERAREMEMVRETGISN